MINMHLMKTLKEHKLLISCNKYWHKKNGILQEINVTTDDKAPFYFKKQAHLFWVRILSKYGQMHGNARSIKRKIIIL